MTSFAWLTASIAFITNLPSRVRSDDTLRNFVTGRSALDLELHAFASDHDLDAADLLVHVLLRLDGDAIERVVAPVGVVVVQHEALNLRFGGYVDGAPDGGVPPRRLEIGLEELGIVDERVGARRERDHRIGFARERILRVRGVDEGAFVGLDAERERRRRMEGARGAHAEPSDLLVASVLELADRELRGQVVDVHRKERVVHPQTEKLAHRARLLRSTDAKRRLRVVRGTKEGYALDVIPVKVREQEIDGERPVTASVHEGRAELAQARAGVEDEKRSGAVANLDACGVAAVTHGERPRCWDGPACSPEADLHECLTSSLPCRARTGPTPAPRPCLRRPASATCASSSQGSNRDRARSVAPRTRRRGRGGLQPCRP